MQENACLVHQYHATIPESETLPSRNSFRKHDVKRMALILNPSVYASSSMTTPPDVRSRETVPRYRIPSLPTRLSRGTWL